MRLPRFVPILSSFTARVAGSRLPGLLQSSTALARALADTQKVVGHDGVLCFFEPSILASSCIGRPLDQIGCGNLHESALMPSDEVLKAAPLANLLESMQVLKHLLPPEALIIATFAGPGLLYRHLAEALEPCGESHQVDPGYVADVVRNAVRSALEQKVDGIALIEQSEGPLPAELLRCHKTTRKLADFYDAGFLLFRLSSTEQHSETHAHCVFDLPPGAEGTGLVSGKLVSATVADAIPVTTGGDMPATSTVEELKALLKTQQCM